MRRWKERAEEVHRECSRKYEDLDSSSINYSCVLKAYSSILEQKKVKPITLLRYDKYFIITEYRLEDALGRLIDVKWVENTVCASNGQPRS